MSEIKGVEITDVLGLSQPLTKLVECISTGIGKIYEPKHISRMAKSEAQALSDLSQAVKDNIELPMKYQNGNLSIDSTNCAELVERTKARILYREIRKQQNVDAIVGNAAEELEKDSKVSEEPVDENWIFHFFNYAENITDETLQKLWGKILAGEVRQPNSFSMNTLEKLKTVSKKEAEFFVRIATMLVRSDTAYFLPFEKTILDKFDITIKDLFHLQENGLLIVDGMLSLKLFICNSEPSCLSNEKIICFLTAKSEFQEISLKSFSLTNAGEELYQIVEYEANYEFAVEYFRFLKNKFANMTITAHKIKSRIQNEISYDLTDLLTPSSYGIFSCDTTTVQ